MWLPAVPCSVGWDWDKGLLWGPRMGPQVASLLPGKWWVCLLPDLGWTAAWSLDGSLDGQDWPWTVAERYWNWASMLFQIPQPRFALQSWMGMAPSRSLDGLNWSLTVARGAGVEYRALSGSLGVQLCFLTGSYARTAWGLWLGVLGPFRISGSTYRSVSCWVPVAAELFTASSWKGLGLSVGPFQFSRVAARCVSYWDLGPSGLL